MHSRRGFLGMAAAAAVTTATAGDGFFGWLSDVLAPPPAPALPPPPPLPPGTILVPRELVEDASFDLLAFIESEVAAKMRANEERLLAELEDELVNGNGRPDLQPLGLLPAIG